MNILRIKVFWWCVDSEKVDVLLFVVLVALSSSNCFFKYFMKMYNPGFEKFQEKKTFIVKKLFQINTWLMNFSTVYILIFFCTFYLKETFEKHGSF